MSTQPEDDHPTMITLVGFILPDELSANLTIVQVLVTRGGLARVFTPDDRPLLEYLSWPHRLEEFKQWLNDHDYEPVILDQLLAHKLVVIYTPDDNAQALDAFTGLRLDPGCFPIPSRDDDPETVWVGHDPNMDNGEVLITSLLGDIMWNSLPDEDIPTAAARLSSEWQIPDNLRGRYFFLGFLELLAEKLACLEWVKDPCPPPPNSVS